MLIILMFAAFLIGAIFFTKNPDATTVRRLNISLFGALVQRLMISGIIPDIGPRVAESRP